MQSNSKAHLLNTRISGSGPTLVLLHGFLSSSEYWERTRALLAKEYTVVAIDLLGFGKSPKPYCSKYDYAAHISSIKLTLETLSIVQPFTLVGHSMGSLLSLRFANMYPQKVHTLLLANMPIMLNPDEVKNEIYSSRVARYGLHPVLQYFTWGIIKMAIRSRLLPYKIKTSLSEHTRYMFQHTGISRVRSFRSIILNGSVEEDLQQVVAKTILLSGLRDRKIYIDNLKKMSLPTSVSVQMVDDAHHTPITTPEILAKLLNIKISHLRSY